MRADDVKSDIQDIKTLITELEKKEDANEKRNQIRLDLVNLTNRVDQLAKEFDVQNQQNEKTVDRLDRKDLELIEQIAAIKEAIRETQDQFTKKRQSMANNLNPRK